MIITNIDRAYPINESWLRDLLKAHAKHMNRAGTTMESFNPRKNVFILTLGGHGFQLDIQEYTAQLIDCESGETILAAVSEGDDFEEKLSSAVTSAIIAYF